MNRSNKEKTAKEIDIEIQEHIAKYEAFVRERREALEAIKAEYDLTVDTLRTAGLLLEKYGNLSNRN